MNRLLPLVFLAQKLLLICSYSFSRLFAPRRVRDSIDWVVGPDELASMVHQISESLPNSYSVSLSRTGAYRFYYDYMLRASGSARLRAWTRLIVGPVLLGRLANRSRGFLYVGATGFLIDSLDHRAFELRYLRAKGRKLGDYWCGSEIRSTKKMHELERETGLPNISTYIGVVSPYYETAAHERVQEGRARVANEYFDVMFDVPTDQRSYLEGHREPFFYFMAPERFIDNTAKFDDLDRLVVTHASTSPIIKGTPLVRAAVAKLRAEGYGFEYVELIGVSNDEIVAQLARSHIVLNQFYGFTTAVFGVEALAAQCALLASSDQTIEARLPPHANDVMMVTKHWQVYDHLKLLLDEPERIRPLALAGQAWVQRYASTVSAGRLLTGILDSVLDGSYDRDARSHLSNDYVYGDRAATPVLDATSEGAES